MRIYNQLINSGRFGLTTSRRFLTGLTLLIVVIGPVTDAIRMVHLSLAYLLLTVVALGSYESTTDDGISTLFILQLTLALAIGSLAFTLINGGFGNRSYDLAAVFILTLLFVLARDDLARFGAHGTSYLLAFAALFGIFLAYSSQYAASSGLGLFPVFAGIILGLNLFVIPRYISQDTVYWSISLIAAGVALLALPTVFIGDYVIGIFNVRTWTETLPIANVPVSRSIYANPNTFGLLMFPGVVASVAAAHRTYELPRHRAVIPLLCFPLTLIGLALSNSRAGILAVVVALGLYVAVSQTHPSRIPLFMTGAAIAVGLFLGGIALGVLPIDPANRFTLWQAGLRALLAEGSLFGQGLVGTSELIEPYLPVGASAYSVHNSYLSIALRAGFIGGGAYLVLVVGPLLHSMVRPALAVRALGMLAIASGFAVHQLFEAYTLYQFGPGSILGALAVGYVIESLTTAPSASDVDADEHDESDENDEEGAAESDVTVDDGTIAVPDDADTNAATGSEPDAESRLRTGIVDGTDDDRNRDRTETRV